jgi:hypothetical protein
MATGDGSTTLRINPKGADSVVIRRNFAIQEKLIRNIAVGVGPNSTDNIVWFSVVTPATDGVTRDFVTPDNYIATTLRIMRDQSTLLVGVDYTETSDIGFNMTLAPDADEALRVGYVKKGIQG